MDKRTYTKEQLLAAMIQYNTDVKENPEKFDNADDISIEEKSKLQVDYLLDKIALN